MFFSWQSPCSDGLAHLFERGHVTGKSLAIGELIGAIGAFGVEIIEQAGGAALVGVLADVAGLFGLVDVAAAIELDDLIVGVKSGVGVDDVGEHLLRGFAGEFLVLRDGVTRAGNFALVAIEDGELDVEEEGAGVGGGDVGIVEAGAEVALAVGVGERFLAARERSTFCWAARRSGRLRSARAFRSSRPALTG